MIDSHCIIITHKSGVRPIFRNNRPLSDVRSRDDVSKTPDEKKNKKIHGLASWQAPSSIHTDCYADDARHGNHTGTCNPQAATDTDESTMAAKNPTRPCRYSPIPEGGAHPARPVVGRQPLLVSNTVRLTGPGRGGGQLGTCWCSRRKKVDRRWGKLYPLLLLLGGLRKFCANRSEASHPLSPMFTTVHYFYSLFFYFCPTITRQLSSLLIRIHRVRACPSWACRFIFSHALSANPRPPPPLSSRSSQ